MVSTQTCNQVFQKLKKDTQNNSCFDCKSLNPMWASVSHGIFLCLQCAGIHRALGVHISFVRSLNLDEWTVRQIQLMVAGGNKKLQQYFAVYPFNNDSVDFKYRSKAAQFYRDRLKSIADGSPFHDQPYSLQEGIQMIQIRSQWESFPVAYIEVQEEEKGSLGKYLDKVVEKSKEIGNKMAEKFHVLSEKPQVKEFQQKTVSIFNRIHGKLGEITEKAREKTNQWGEKPGVQSFKQKTKDTFRFFSRKTKETINKLKKNPDEQ